MSMPTPHMGDEVRSITTGERGTVIEVEMNRVVVEHPNGTSSDRDASDWIVIGSE